MVEQRSWKYMFYLVIFMGLVGQMDVWLSLIETSAVPFLIAEFGVTIIDFGFWAGAFGVIVFLVFFIGWFSDAFGRKKGILLLILVMGIPALFIGLFAITFHLFLLLYAIAIMGTTSNLWEVPIAEESPAEKRGLYGALAFLISVIPLSSIVGVDIIGLFGWRWGYGAMFFIMIILLVFLFFMKEPKRWVDAREKRGEKRLGIIEALKSLGRKDLTYVTVATIVYLTWTTSFKLGTLYGGYYFVTVLGYDFATQWKSVLTIAGLLLPVSAIITGVLLDKGGRNITLVLGSIGSVVSFIGLGFTTMPAFYWGVYFFMAMLLAWIYVYIAEIFPTAVRSTSIGVAVTGSRLGYVIGPIIAAVLLMTDPTMTIFWIVSGIIMIIPLLSLLTKPYETKGKTLEVIQEER